MSFYARFARLIMPVLAIGALALAGCGEKQDITLEGKEGERLNIGDLVYQVQLSRILNPRDVEDEAYTRNEPAPAASESYYGVFLRVDNEESDKPLSPVAVEKLVLRDAGGTEFHPIALDFPGLVYEPARLVKGERVPIPDTVADNYPTKGGLILFKIPYTSLDNRPLILEIEGPHGDNGEIVLDV